MICKKILLVTGLLTAFVQISHAETGTVFPTKRDAPVDQSKETEVAKVDGKDVNVFFYGDVTENKVVELQQALDTININYPKARAINLYINSPGGEVRAGWTGYWAIKSSVIPVKTIGAGFVASMATLLYCASSERSAVKQNEFYLHAPSTTLNEIGRPDVVRRLGRELDKISDDMIDIYTACTTLNKQEIADIAKAEYFAKSLNTEDAIKIGMSQKLAEKILPAGAAFYIFDKPSKFE
ncbi:ATP-dependent Clp protease proteolytic subunit [Paenochrobactrum sp. BZR 588]|uniref:ATP-dependent Clp protease proteolytic subunit n=1 Tax=Paenochrobactrum TaxID=999488 RepID=UPI0035BC00CC